MFSLKFLCISELYSKLHLLVWSELLWLCQHVGCNWQWTSAFVRLKQSAHSCWFHKTTRVLMSVSIMRSKRKKVHFRQINRNKRWIHARKTVKSEKEPGMNLFNALKPLDVPKLCCHWLVPNINIWLHPNMAKKISLHTRKHLWKFELRKSENFSG